MNRRVVLVLGALAVLAFGLLQLRFDVEILNLLPAKLAVAKGLKLYQQNFSDARRLLLTVEGATAEETENAARSLARYLRGQTNLIAGAQWQPPWMENPGELSELIAFLWLNQPPSECAKLVDRLRPENLTNVLQETQERLATSFSPADIALGGYDPFGLTQLPGSAGIPTVGQGDQLFASEDGRFRLVYVQASSDLDTYRKCTEWLQAVRQLVVNARAAHGIPAGVEIHFTDRPVFVAEIAGSMEKDMAGSATGTMMTIGVLFWLTHRRLRPLLWLLGVLTLILAGTLAVGGLMLGTLNVVSLGFAAILLGLAEDFGIVIYQESRSHPGLDAAQLRRETAPGILWSALTTAGAFAVLNLSVLPGLGQLGSLVAIGIVLGAAVMLYVYLPVLLRLRRVADSSAVDGRERFLLFRAQKVLPSGLVWAVTVLTVAGCAAWLWKNGLSFDHSPNPLKPRRSEAASTLERIQTRLAGGKEPLWVFIPGRDEEQVAERLKSVENWLAAAKTNGWIDGFTLPTALWPEAGNQRTNRELLQTVVQEKGALREAAVAGGFTTNSLAMTEAILDTWQRAAKRDDVFWPTNGTSQWIYQHLMARTTNGFLTLGLVETTNNPELTRELSARWPVSFEQQGILLSGWKLLGSTVFQMAARDLPRLVALIGVLVLLTLYFAFKRWQEIALSVATLAFTGVVLATIMELAGWQWNLLNLMAIPLLLGMGVDYSIHMQLALRRHHGDRLLVQQSVGRALLLAGSTTIAGFASLGFSSNTGMASLGKACALGIAVALLTAVYLLPVWWSCIGRAPNKPRSC